MLAVCPTKHGKGEMSGGWAVYPVPRPLYLHDPPRPAYDFFNAFLRRDENGNLTWNKDYLWGDPESKIGHEGVDLGCAKKAVRVSQIEGVVWAVDLINDSSAGVHVAILTKCPECSGWFLFRYLHLLVGSVVVVKGQVVKQGDLIGTQGMSGNSGWYHSHFEIRHTTNSFADKWTIYAGNWGTPYDPLAWLDATLSDIPLPTLEDIMFCKKGDGVSPNPASPVVKYWQLRLNRLGAGLTTDGRYGSLTQAAVVAQVGGDGAQIGPDEAEKLDAAVAAAPVPVPPGTYLVPGDYTIHLG